VASTEGTLVESWVEMAESQVVKVAMAVAWAVG
jgi:hypothetical protein